MKSITTDVHPDEDFDTLWQPNPRVSVVVSDLVVPGLEVRTTLTEHTSKCEPGSWGWRHNYRYWGTDLFYCGFGCRHWRGTTATESDARAGHGQVVHLCSKAYAPISADDSRGMPLADYLLARTLFDAGCRPFLLGEWLVALEVDGVALHESDGWRRQWHEPSPVRGRWVGRR